MRVLKQGKVCRFVLLATMLGAPAIAQVVSLTTNQLQFSYVLGSSTVPPAVTVTASSTAPTTITSVTAASAPTAWLGAVALGGATPADISIFLNAAALTSLVAGQYTGTVTITATPSDPTSQTSVAVFLNVTTTGRGSGIPTITASPNLMNFTASPGGAAPPAQTLNVNVADGSGFVVTTSTNDGGTWLQTSPNQFASAPGAITVTVNPGKLGPGVYSGLITLTGYLQLTVPVTFTIGTSPFTISPASLTFTIPANYGPSASQYINVATVSPVQFLAFPTSDTNWLQTEAPSGNTPFLLGVKVNAADLPQGTYQGKVTIQQTPAYSVDIPVTLVIGPPAVLSIAPSSFLPTWTVGDAVPINQSIRVSSLSAVQQTFTLSTNLITGTGWLTATATANSTPTTVNISVNPTGLTPGVYLASVVLTPSGASASPQLISVALTVSAAPNPVITAVQSAASGAPGVVAPGELVTIIGKGVGPKTLQVFTTTNNAVPTSVGNTTVTFDGTPAPIIYASAAATTVQVPYTITPGSTTSLKVTYTTAQSIAVPIQTQAVYPGLFSLDSTGKGQAAALNQDLSVNSPNNPAARGTIVVLYGTGEGVTTPALTAGSIVPLTPPYPQPASPPVVYFNGVPGNVLYAGEAPGSVAGLFQINVRVPANISAGAVSVQAAFGGQGTQSGLTISVQ